MKINLHKEAAIKRALSAFLQSHGVYKINNHHVSCAPNKKMVTEYNRITGQNCQYIKGSFGNQFNHLPPISSEQLKEISETNRKKQGIKSVSEKKKEYKEYLNSDQWADKRRELFALRGRKCEICGSVHEIHVHHLTYANIFNEPMEDLQVVCQMCHSEIHKRPTGSAVKNKSKQKSKEQYKEPDLKDVVKLTIKVYHGRKTITFNKKRENMAMSVLGYKIDIDHEELLALAEYIKQRAKQKNQK